MRPVLIALAASSFALPAMAAEKDKLDAGDDAPGFAAKTLNADAAKLRVFTLDSVVGPEATDRKKAVVVSFVAAACDSCKKELAFLAALQAEFKDKGLLVVSVDIDKDEAETRKIADLVAASKIDFPVINDRFNIVANRYLVTKPPQLHVIDETGKIAKTAVAYDDSAYADILSEVRKSLGLPVSDPTPVALASFVKTMRTADQVASAPASAQVAVELDDKKKGKRLKLDKKPKTAKTADDKKTPKRIVPRH